MFSIIVVEDNTPVCRGLVHEISKNHDYLDIVGDAANGVEAKNKILQLQPQIILTDIRLPGLSGLELIKEVQTVYSPQVIVISGYTEFEYAREALSLGVLAYLVKPIDEKELSHALKSAVSRILDEQEESVTSWLSSHKKRQTDEQGNVTEQKSRYIQSHYSTQVIRYIQQNYSHDFSLSDIADHLEISESHLSKLFKEQTMLTINEYKINYRITQAAKLLANPQYRINQIARFVGLENQRYFSILFKRIMGVTPSEYRNAILADQKEESN